MKGKDTIIHMGMKMQQYDPIIATQVYTSIYIYNIYDKNVSQTSSHKTTIKYRPRDTINC